MLTAKTIATHRGWGRGRARWERVFRIGIGRLGIDDHLTGTETLVQAAVHTPACMKSGGTRVSRPPLCQPSDRPGSRHREAGFRRVNRKQCHAMPLPLWQMKHAGLPAKLGTAQLLDMQAHRRGKRLVTTKQFSTPPGSTFDWIDTVSLHVANEEVRSRVATCAVVAEMLVANNTMTTTSGGHS